MAERFLTKWEPFRDLVSLRSDMDRLFSSFFSSYPESTDGFWAPVVDIEENNGNIVVKAELPGMKKEDIKLTVHNNVLSISGERSQETETKDKTFHRIERSYGRFNRIINLPVDVEAEKIKAVYKDGILNVTLPKPESVKPKQINVEVN